MNEHSRALRAQAGRAAAGLPCKATVMLDGADAIDALVARIAELEAAQKWRDMASAPRDGSVINIGVAHRWLESTGRFELTGACYGWLPLPSGEQVKEG